MKKAVLFFAVLIAAIPCVARIITVDDDGPADFNNIQAAIDDATNGDTVEIQPGRYTGPGNRNIDFKGKPITVRSTDPNDPNTLEATIIDCNGLGRGFYFWGSRNGPDCVVNGLTIINGDASQGTGAREGGGICCDEYASPTIRACRIMGNWANSGGGIYIGNGSTAVIDRCLITRNSVSSTWQGQGGGVYCSVSSDALISNCMVSNNQASGSSIPYGEGGGLCLSNCPATVRHCTIVNNTAAVAGGISCNEFAEHIIANCIVWGNGTADSAQIVGTPSVSYSNVQGGYPGNANTSTDPRFVDPSAGNYHLSADSPCRDSGDPLLYNLGSTNSDIDGEPRVMGPRTDRGADEFTDEVLEMPIVGLSSTEFVFKAVESGLDPEPQILTVRNIGLGTLIWHIHHDCSWLGLDENAGQSSGDPNYITLSIDISALSWGAHQCELTIDPEISANGPQTVTVNLHIRRASPLLVPAEYGSIQQAINAAAWGDTIKVSSGTYNENVRLLGKNLTLTSADPGNPEIVANTIINGNGIGPVVTFAGTENEDCKLNGFTITGGYAPKPAHGGGIQGNGTRAGINDCVITGNSSYRRGGGLFDFDGPITSCTITQNSVSSPASTEGGGLHSCDGPITDCTISYNTSGSPTRSGFAGGLYNCDGPITGCTIIGNSAGGTGGGLQGCDGLIINSNIVGNTAWSDRFKSSGGGFYDCDGSITNCSVLANIAWESGGGFFGCSGHISHCLIYSNEAQLWDGGGLGHCESVSNCTITDNSAGNHGGGLHECSSIINSAIANNLAGVNGGALHNCSEVINCTVVANHASEKGGAVYIQGHAKTANCILWDNTATDGPEICLEPYIIRSEFGDREYPSSMDVQFSNVRGGVAAVSATDCILNWGPGNIDLDPCFADANNSDYHLKSQASRYDPNGETWVIDEATSPCIDAGDPMDPIGPEPFPNGGIINMGAYGGTAEASKSYFNKPPCQTIIASDINGDCEVDFEDFSFMALHWLEVR